MNIFETLEKNKFSYEDIKSKSFISLRKPDREYDVNVIIGFRGRKEFLKPVSKSFKEAFTFYNSKYGDKSFCLTFVEHNNNNDTAIDLLHGVDSYILTPGNVVDQYSRSFAYNFGVKYSNKAKYYLLHDIDIIVKENFFEEVFMNLKDNKCLQTYGGRRVLYMTDDLTKEVISGVATANINTFTKNTDRVSLPGILGSKGGSIMVERNFYYEIGGFDPELFWGYAAEDQIFWDKALTLLGEVAYADNPSIDMFHMWHPPSHTTNPLLYEMESYMLQFRGMGRKDRHKFLTIKKELFKDEQ